MREVKRLLDSDGMFNPGVLLNDDPQSHMTHIKRTPSVGDETVDHCVECGFCERLCPSRALTLTPRQRIVGDRVRTRSSPRPGTRTATDRFDQIREEYSHDGTATCVADGLCGTVCSPRRSTSPTSRITNVLRLHGARLERLMDLAARRFAVVEELLRRGVDLGSAADDHLGGAATSWATAAARRLVPNF